MRPICNVPCTGFRVNSRNEVAGRIDGAGWGLFLLWVGLSLLLDLGWGIGLLGVGLLTLAMQGVRRVFGLDQEGFWLLVGGVLSLAGIWELAEIGISLAPVLLVGVGLVVLISALSRTRR